MTLDVDKYRSNIPMIKHLTKDMNEERYIEYSGSVAVATGVPIIVVTAFLGEIYGFTPMLIARLGRLLTFYGVDTLLNIERGQLSNLQTLIHTHLS